MRKALMLAAPAVLLFTLVHVFTAAIFAQEGGRLHVRIAHFSVDTPTVDLYIDHELSSVQNLSFGEITEWFTLASGDYALSVVAAGTEDAILEADHLNFDAGDWVTLTLIGTVGRDTLAFQPVVETYRELSSGEARLSIFQAVEGLTTTDVLLNGNLFFQFLNYPSIAHDSDRSGNDGFVSSDVIANPYMIQLTANQLAEAILLDLGEIRLMPNHNHFISIIGTTANPSFTHTAVDLPHIRSARKSDIREVHPPQETTGRLRIAHFSSGTPPVDIYINEELSVIRGLAFPAMSAFVELPAGVHTIAVIPAGLNLQDAFIPPMQISLPAGKWMTVAFIGTLENDSLTLQEFEEDFGELGEFSTRISVFHGIQGIRSVNIQLADGTTLVRLLGYPGSQGNNDGHQSFDLIAGTYHIQIVSSADPEQVIVDLPDQPLAAGRYYLLALIRAEPPYLLTFVETVHDE